jgi:hypothetical protein
MFTDDDNQIEVPPSFVSLYTAPGGQRLLQPIGHVRDRYELCEDMAQMLTEQAAAARFKTDHPEGEVLNQMRQVLSSPESPVSPSEAEWVVLRIAELLGWRMPER